MVGMDPTKSTTIKFLCSYGGKILPRYPDGKLRYLGGDTRVLAVPRSIPFSELLLKLGELCGNPVNLRCQLPAEDLDALVSIKSDEDLINLIEEYDRAAAAATTSPPQFGTNLKIRAFLTLIPKQISSPPSSTASTGFSSSTTSSSSSSSSNYMSVSGSTPRFHILPMAPVDRRHRQIPPPSATAVPFQRSPPKVPHCANIYHAHQGPGQHGYGNKSTVSSPAASRLYLVHNGNHWQ